MALESWPLPGEQGFPLNAFYGKFDRKPPKRLWLNLNLLQQPFPFSGKAKGSETGELKSYLTQVLFWCPAHQHTIWLLDWIGDKCLFFFKTCIHLKKIQLLAKFLACLPDPTGDWQPPGGEGFLTRPRSPGARWCHMIVEKMATMYFANTLKLFV